MPHVGGGSNSGGFSYSSSSHSTTPKYDLNGNLHSKYYVRPGYYYNRIYIPYSKRYRGAITLKTPIIAILVSFIFITIGILAMLNVFEVGDMEDYSLKKYSEIYDSKSEQYEENILIEIVPHKDSLGINYLPIVGNNVDIKIDEYFGNENSFFGGKLLEQIKDKEKPVESIYLSIGNALEMVNNKLTTTKNAASNDRLIIKNETNYEIVGLDILQSQINVFTSKTGYGFSVVISRYNDVYNGSFITYAFIIMGSVALAVSAYQLINCIKALKKINKEEQNGNGKEYFEGEVEYEKYLAKYPNDKKYKYKNNEFKFLDEKFKSKEENEF